MPIISSRGLASSGGFGQFAIQQVASYKYLMQSLSNNIYATNTPLYAASSAGNWLTLPRQPESRTIIASNNTSPYNPGFMHNSKGAVTNWQKSTFNNNWTGSNVGSYSASLPRLGQGSSMAYNPTSKLAAIGYFLDNGEGIRTPFVVFTNLDTGAQTVTNPNIPDGSNTAVPYSVVYSPTLNAFYMNKSGVIYIFNGNTGAYIGQAFGNDQGQALDISSDGYLLDNVRTTGSNYRIDKFTTQDLSSPTQIGTFTNPQGNNYSRRVYVSANNTYYRLRFGSGFNPSVDITSWQEGSSETSAGSVPTSGMDLIYRAQLLYEDGYFYTVLNGRIPDGEGGFVPYSNVRWANISDLNTWTTVYSGFLGQIASISIRQ